MNTKLFTIMVTILLSTVSCKNTSQVSKAQLLDSKYQAILDGELNESNTGILVNITSPDKDLSWSGASGFSDKETETPLLPNSQTFRIASVTKTFVATTILRLWEDKKLELDDPISKYISREHVDLLISGGYEPDKITIRHLLNHSSGMAEHVNSPKYELEFMKTRHEWTRTETIEDLVKYSKPVGKPGEQFSYSDTGYILLGEVIEKLTGKSMGEAIVEVLDLKNLGIKNTYQEPYEGDFTGKRMHQYFQNEDTYNFHPSMDYYGGGGLLSTTDDLSRFFYLLFQHKIFSNKSTLDTMLAPVAYKTKQALDYRMGIWRIEINGVEAYTHTGFWGTQVVYVPSISTVISTNYSQRWTNSAVAPVIPKIVGLLNSNDIKVLR